MGSSPAATCASLAKNLYPHNDTDAPASGPCVTKAHTCDALNTWNGPITGPIDGKFYMFNPLYAKGSLLQTQAMMLGVVDDIVGPYNWTAWPNMGANPAFVAFADPLKRNQTTYSLWTDGQVFVSDSVGGPYTAAGPGPGGKPAPIFYNGRFYATSQSTAELVTAAKLGDPWEHFADIKPRLDKGTQEDPFMCVGCGADGLSCRARLVVVVMVGGASAITRESSLDFRRVLLLVGRGGVGESSAAVARGELS